MSASAYRRAREVAAKKVAEDQLAASIKQEEVPVINVTIEPQVEEVTIQCTISNDEQIEVKSELDKDNSKVKKVKRTSK